MNFKTNIPELIQKLEQVKEAVGGNNNGVPPIPDFSDALLSALNAGMGNMKFRIFDKGLDAEGIPLGKYTKAYEKVRLKHGRFIDKKDLQFTGSLHASINSVKNDNKQVMIAIVNEQTSKISFYQEEQVGRMRGTDVARIFEFSESEFEQIQAEANAAIDQVIGILLEAE